MLTTVEGVYKNGTVVLAEKPAGHENAKVLVTFLEGDDREIRAPKRMTFGMFSAPGAFNEEDFNAAEAHISLDDY